MSKYIVLLLVVLSVCYIRTENIFGRTVRNWVSRSFGINAHEPLLNMPFNPTIANLNTVTLRPCNQTGNARETVSVAEAAHILNSETLTDTGVYLGIKDEHQEVAATWHIQKEMCVEPNETIFVYSRGYAGAQQPENPKTRTRQPRGLCGIPKRGGGIVTGYQWIKNGIINGPCIFFDYPDTRSYFDFGLKNDQRCLDVIYDELTQTTQQIIFFGNCRGSKALLYYLVHSQPKDVKAVVLDAPFMDLVQFTQQIGLNYGKILPFSKDIAYKVIQYWHPSYRLEDDLTLDDLQQIPTHFPLFIGHLYNDALVANEMIKKMVAALRDSGHTVYLLILDDHTKSHSRLYQIKQFQQAVNAFFKRYNLPHDPKLAHEGRFLLNYAEHSANHPDNWYIYKID